MSKWDSHTEYRHKAIIHHCLAWRHGHAVAAVCCRGSVLSRAQLWLAGAGRCYLEASRSPIMWIRRISCSWNRSGGKLRVWGGDFSHCVIQCGGSGTFLVGSYLGPSKKDQIHPHIREGNLGAQRRRPKRPKEQNVPGTKRPRGQNVQH